MINRYIVNLAGTFKNLFRMGSVLFKYHGDEDPAGMVKITLASDETIRVGIDVEAVRLVGTSGGRVVLMTAEGTGTDGFFPLPAGSPTDGQVLAYDNSLEQTKWVDQDFGAGTVTSVDVDMPADFTKTGGPVVDDSTISFAWGVETAHDFHVGPVSGSPAAPTWRAMDDTDLPAVISGTRIDSIVSTQVSDFAAAVAALDSGARTDEELAEFVQDVVGDPTFFSITGSRSSFYDDSANTLNFVIPAVPGTVLTEAQVAFDYTTGDDTVNITTLASGTIVVKVEVIINPAFDGDSHLSVGIDSANEVLVPAGQADTAVADRYELTTNYLVESDDDYNVYLHSEGGSVGAAVVILTFLVTT